MDPQILKLILEPLNERLDNQDEVLEKILVQAKETNGRMTDAEKRLDIRDALEEQEEKWTLRRRLQREAVIGFVCILLGGVLSGLTHLF